MLFFFVNLAFGIGTDGQMDRSANCFFVSIDFFHLPMLANGPYSTFFLCYYSQSSTLSWITVQRLHMSGRKHGYCELHAEHRTHIDWDKVLLERKYKNKLSLREIEDCFKETCRQNFRNSTQTCFWSQKQGGFQKSNQNFNHFHWQLPSYPCFPCFGPQPKEVTRHTWTSWIFISN